MTIINDPDRDDVDIAREAAGHLARHPDVYELGKDAVRLHLPEGELAFVQELDIDATILAVADVCRPVAVRRDRATGEAVQVPVALPPRIARLVLAMRRPERALRPLVGITGAPGLGEHGELHTTPGYCTTHRVFRGGLPPLDVPERPTRADAEAALRTLRAFFRTFPYADAPRAADGFVDLEQPPGLDESSALVALLTAVARPSLRLAPAIAVIAPQFSGAGSGKGKLLRCTTFIAYGIHARVLPGGHDDRELDKRLVSAALAARPSVVIDNLNNTTLTSTTLAVLIAERPAEVRPLGRSELLEVDAPLFIAVTGNGLRLSEDLARRFIVINFDPRCADPELRRFDRDPEAEARRGELLAAALTIWRWGRQQGDALPRGQPLGSFETWARWCRDPLLALGCRDPVERITAIKAADPRRRALLEAFEAWHEAHGARPVKLAELDDDVRALLDPHGRGRQFLAHKLAALTGTQIGPYVLESQRGSGAKAKTFYAAIKAEAEPDDGHERHEKHATLRARESEGKIKNGNFELCDTKNVRGKRHASDASHAHLEVPSPEPPVTRDGWRRGPDGAWEAVE